jgi:hypothetical protein
MGDASFCEQPQTKKFLKSVAKRHFQKASYGSFDQQSAVNLSKN